MGRPVSVRVKVWLSIGDKPLIGEGGYQLLLGIARTGSIRKAAEDLGLSYTFAWKYVRRIEKLLGREIVETRRGGRLRGGALLTEDGVRLLKLYEGARNAVESTIKGIKVEEVF